MQLSSKTGMMQRMRILVPPLLAILTGLPLPACASGGLTPAQGLERIQHIVVIYLENHGFDNLYGHFPGAEGLAAAGDAPLQADATGQPYATLPAVMNTERKPVEPDPRFPADLPNGPFPIDRYVAPSEKTGDLVHRFYQHQAQIDGGRNDRYAAISDAGGLAMGYYDGSRLPLWSYAQRYTLADHFFQGAFGGSFLNHMWLVCACTPRYPDAPAHLKAELDADGKLLRDGALTPDGYAVNTIQPAAPPYRAGTAAARRLPPQTLATIGDRLSDKDISWAWYAGGWDDAVAGKPDALFQYHHQPFVYFARYAEGTKERARHLRDERQFLTAIDTGTLPAVSFYKPIGALNEHPGYAALIEGERHVAELLARIERSPDWHEIAVIVTYDENGGFWDHVAPPHKDRWGPGSRVPTLIVSPYAKQGYVDHTEYDTTSILRFIEHRFGLAPLGERDAHANDLSNAFTFSTAPP